MKNVWVLERFVTVEDMKNHIADFKDIIAETENEENEDYRRTAQEMLENTEKQLEENPEGYWMGYIGKSNYKVFCNEAKDFMRRHENDLLKSGVRAVKVQIGDSEKYWIGYENAIVNDGVTRYLYATYRQ